jgi:predicted nucleotide-binding protein
VQNRLFDVTLRIEIVKRRDSLGGFIFAPGVNFQERRRGKSGANMENEIRWSYRPNIYIHAPTKPAGPQATVKSAILDEIKRIGFDPQEFGASGMPKGYPWSFDRAIEIMRQCDGAMQNAAQWLAGGSLANASAFQTWVESVSARHDVFFGYCSKADKVARNIKTYLTDEVGMRVLDWATDFQPGQTIMEEVARATATCRCGLFLFTTDDPIEGPSTAKAIPRDNVLLEAGYFMSAHTAKRMVVIRESGTKMPADLGGMIYLTLNRRNEWKSVAKDVVTAIRKQLSGNIHAKNR